MTATPVFLCWSPITRPIFQKKRLEGFVSPVTTVCAYEEAIQKAIETGEGQTCWMTSQGVNSKGEVVSQFEFEWSVKVK